MIGAVMSPYVIPKDSPALAPLAPLRLRRAAQVNHPFPASIPLAQQIGYRPRGKLLPNGGRADQGDVSGPIIHSVLIIVVVGAVLPVPVVYKIPGAAPPLGARGASL